jgi:hypothetical protein
MPARMFSIREIASRMSVYTDKAYAVPGPSPEEPNKFGDPERRALNRVPFTAAAEVHELRSQARVTGRCSDLGPGGCYVDTLTPFGVGASVRIRMERDMRVFEAAGIVAYAHISLGMGLKFTEIKGEYQDILRAWITELDGGQPLAEPDAGAADGNVNTLILLSELVTLLVRKRTITEIEGARLLRRMFQ